MRFRPLVSLVVATSAVAACRSPRATPDAPAPTPVPDARVVPTDTAAIQEELRRRLAAESLSVRDSLAARDSAARAAARPARPEKSGQRCLLDLENTPETRTQLVRDPVSGRYYTYIGGGVRGKCRGQDITIASDSAESYDQSRLYILIGNVRYREPRITIDAQRATYFQTEERLLLEINVHAVSPDGTVMDGQRAEYFRAVQGIRDRSRLVATNRPGIAYTEKDSLGRPQPPVNVNANEITVNGDSTIVANGRVLLTRTDLVAQGDSAFVDNRTQWARIMKQPRIESKGAESYVLVGRVIDLFGASRQVNRVLAMDSAKANSKDLELVSDTIDLRVANNKLERAFAWGPGGARATTPQRDIVADSLFVVMPNQRVRELHAIRKAYAESDPDSTKVLSDERDWLRGDTIVARFDSLPPADTTSQPRVREIIATGSAQSYYQVPASNGDRTAPGINYVRGDIIRVTFDSNDVRMVTVQGSASGMYLESAPDTAGPARAGRARPPAPRRPPGGQTRPPGDPMPLMRGEREEP